MLSPASSLELFMETKQQKRVKEEKMYGQIVEELSAVELTNSDIKKGLSRPQKPLEPRPRSSALGLNPLARGARTPIGARSPQVAPQLRGCAAPSQQGLARCPAWLPWGAPCPQWLLTQKTKLKTKSRIST